MLNRLPYDILTNSYDDVVEIEKSKSFKQYHILLNKSTLYIFTCHCKAFQIDKEDLLMTIDLKYCDIVRDEGRGAKNISEDPIISKFVHILNQNCSLAGVSYDILRSIYATQDINEPFDLFLKKLIRLSIDIFILYVIIIMINRLFKTSIKYSKLSTS